MTRFKNIATISATMLAAALLATGGSTAEAAHRQPNDPLMRIALRLEGATRELSYNAEHASHHASQRELRSLRRFDQLQHEAREFRIALQRRGPLSSRTEREYGELTTAFDRAERALFTAHARTIVRNDFREVERRLNQLDTVLRREVASAQRYRGAVRIGRAWPRRGVAEIAYNGSFRNADVRIRYVKREDDYDDRSRRDEVRYHNGKKHKRAYDDDDSSD